MWVPACVAHVMMVTQDDLETQFGVSLFADRRKIYKAINSSPPAPSPVKLDPLLSALVQYRCCSRAWVCMLCG